jgi:hypothetical protein
MTRTLSRYPLSIETAAPGRPVRTRTRQDRTGVSVQYLGRSLLPLPSAIQRQSSYTVQAGDRIDNVSARLLGDPLLYWMLMEANGASDPGLLCAVPGRKIIVPSIVGLGSSPFDQPQAAKRTAAAAPQSQTDDQDQQP